jgi:hypothetical protein
MTTSFLIVLLISSIVTDWVSQAIPFSLFNATQILSIAHLSSCSPACSPIPTTHQTVESKFIIKSIKNRVQNFAYHQKSINPSSISGAAGNKAPKPGKGRSVREISTLSPKPRAEGSSPSAPAKIAEQKRCSRRNLRIYGGFRRF